MTTRLPGWGLQPGMCPSTALLGIKVACCVCQLTHSPLFPTSLAQKQSSGLHSHSSNPSCHCPGLKQGQDSQIFFGLGCHDAQASGCGLLVCVGLGAYEMLHVVMSLCEPVWDDFTRVYFLCCVFGCLVFELGLPM